jgi:predicted  nucleic acid-binding Zn-ribbon protein
MRFSAVGASLREKAIQRILEQNLAAADSTKGLTEVELRRVIDLGGNGPMLKAADVREGIERLASAGRIVEIKEARKTSYGLSPVVQSEIQTMLWESEEKYESVLVDLFGSAQGGSEAYKSAFIRLLCLIFSRLGDLYVKVITGTHTKDSFMEHELLNNIMQAVLNSNIVPDIAAFKYGVNRFFRESSPQFDIIKWNMAQNYYICKALGIDESAKLLSADVLNGMSFYLDTNVLIAGLIPEDRHHGSFQELFSACKNLNIKAKVTRITIEELKSVISLQSDLLRRVIDKIPEGTKNKVRNFLLERFLTAKKENPDLSVENFLAHFRAPIESLQESFELEIVDDDWFDKERDSSVTEYLARELVSKYEKIRKRFKSKVVSIHDALLLQWVSNENITLNGKCRLVTLDLSLVDYIAEKIKDLHPIVITLDALLQWTIPQCIEVDENRLAEIYSQAIKYQLLPREVFFDLRDFQVFADMEIETSILPPEDVESCIRDIRAMGPSIDPRKPEDREKITRTIQRYFADPGTKFRKEMERLAERNKELSEKAESERKSRENAESQISKLSEETQGQKNEIEELKQGMEAERQARSTAEERISQMEKAITDRKRKCANYQIVR